MRSVDCKLDCSRSCLTVLRRHPGPSRSPSQRNYTLRARAHLLSPPLIGPIASRTSNPNISPARSRSLLDVSSHISHLRTPNLSFAPYLSHILEDNCSHSHSNRTERALVEPRELHRRSRLVVHGEVHLQVARAQVRVNLDIPGGVTRQGSRARMRAASTLRRQSWLWHIAHLAPARFLSAHVMTFWSGAASIRVAR